MDEEELLGFNVFVAELELLVSKHRVQTEGSFSLEYSGALVEVLQKLVVSLDHTNIEALKSCQGRCEQVLNGVLFKGACPEVGFFNKEFKACRQEHLGDENVQTCCLE